MYEEHPVFILPENRDVKIWRYLDIPKFLWLVEKKTLYFSRCDLLGDPFEGSLPSASGQRNFNKSISKNTSDGKSERIFSSHEDLMRKECFVCSFHMNEHESAALWSIYAKSKQGVAIQLTINKLINALNSYSVNPVFIGAVKYIDYQSEVIDVTNSFSPIMHKRKSFEHERELRAVIGFPDEVYEEVSDGDLLWSQVRKDLPAGLNVPIDLHALVDCIYLAPTTKSWIKEMLLSIMTKNEISLPVEQSSLDADPII